MRRASLVLSLLCVACQAVDSSEPRDVARQDAGTDSGRSDGQIDGGGPGGFPGGGGGPGGFPGGGGGPGGGGSGPGGFPGGGGDGGGPGGFPGGGDAGVPDAAPPPPPACETFDLPITVRLAEDRLYARNEPAEIIVDAPGAAELSAEADVGGRLRYRADRVFWSAGGGERGDVDWPWWTGPVRVTVTARGEGDRCGRADAVVRLAGDVLVTDWGRGGLYALGSDGRKLGRWKQLAEQGLGPIIALPPARTGGFVVVLRPSNEQPFRIVRLDGAGRITDDFELTDLAQEPLFEENQDPEHLVYDPIRGEVLADAALRDRVPRWRPNGEYIDAWDVPGSDSGFSYRAVGFGVVGGGTVIVGHESHTRLYALNDGGPELWGELMDSPQALGPGHDRGLVGCSIQGNSTYYYQYDADGREVRTEEAWQASARQIAAFRDGYLGSEPVSSRLRYIAADLSLPDDPDAFRQTHGFDDIQSIGGFVWLHFPEE